MLIVIITSFSINFFAYITWFNPPISGEKNLSGVIISSLDPLPKITSAACNAGYEPLSSNIITSSSIWTVPAITSHVEQAKSLPNVNYIGYVNNDEIRKKLPSYDVYCFPSILIIINNIQYVFLK